MVNFNSMLYTKRRFNIFGEQYFSEYSTEMIQSIRSEIESFSKDYILNINEDVLVDSIDSRYRLEPITFYVENLTFLGEPTKREHKHISGTYVYYNFIMELPYTGSSAILRLMPSQRLVIDYTVYIDLGTNIAHNKIYAEFEVLGRNTNSFNDEQNKVIRSIMGNLDNINREVENWNQNLEQTIKGIFTHKKNEYLADNQFFESVNIKVNKGTEALFTPPLIKKKIIPVPKINEKNKKFSNVPTVDMTFYNDIINTINKVCKSMERKPSTYIGKNEEGLRDNILMFLETRYESTTGTSETFNKGGKTDILLKFTDGTNLFVSECKIWHGEKEFLDAINQLFKYLTWRDSKAALIIFVKNKDFSAVIKSVNVAAQKYSLFKKVKTVREETSLSYIFKFPDDSEKEVMLEVMLFHFPINNN